MKFRKMHMLGLINFIIAAEIAWVDFIMKEIVKLLGG